MSDSQSTLTVAQIAVSLVTPITVAAVGYALNLRLKKLESAQWQNRRITEKRISIYDEISPQLNLTFCFCHFVGYWKDITPRQMLESKRFLDKNINIYRHLLSESFYESYQDYINTIFRTYTGHGKDATIRSHIVNSWGNRRIHASYNWEPDFEFMFDDSDIPSDEDITNKYLETMNAFRRCIGLENE